jgi:hypothetical protein
MFALANGYLGIRRMPEEGRPVREPGVFLNGFHEFRPINYSERAYGFPDVQSGGSPTERDGAADAVSAMTTASCRASRATGTVALTPPSAGILAWQG